MKARDLEGRMSPKPRKASAAHPLSSLSRLTPLRHMLAHACVVRAWFTELSRPRVRERRMLRKCYECVSSGITETQDTMMSGSRAVSDRTEGAQTKILTSAELR
eukprot:5519426-Pleurochrysis_carterae.AAC.2